LRDLNRTEIRKCSATLRKNFFTGLQSSAASIRRAGQQIDDPDADSSCFVEKLISK